MSRTIKQNIAQSRFEWTEAGVLCVLDYQLQNSVLTVLHTGVPDAVGGRGIAADLTRYALDTARKQGLKVRPLCSYTAAYINRYPDYKDLLA